MYLVRYHIEGRVGLVTVEGAATVTSSSRSVERADPELVESCRKAGIVDADGDL